MELRELNKEMSRLLQYGLQRGLLEREDLPLRRQQDAGFAGGKGIHPPSRWRRLCPTPESPWSASATGRRSRAF